MTSQSPQQTTPAGLRALVTGVLATFRHSTLQKDLNAIKALHHCVLMDDVLHIDLTLPFAWKSGFEILKEETSGELLRVTGASAIQWTLRHDIATLKRANDQPGIKRSEERRVGKECRSRW